VDTAMPRADSLISPCSPSKRCKPPPQQVSDYQQPASTTSAVAKQHRQPVPCGGKRTDQAEHASAAAITFNRDQAANGPSNSSSLWPG
jgi:hypothetical protein